MLTVAQVRLPDLVVMVHTKDKVQYRDHPAIIDAAKVMVSLVTVIMDMENLHCRSMITDHHHNRRNWQLLAQVGIPTLGLVDTDCNPNLITFPVPGNDDSQDSVQLFLNLVKQAVLLGKERRRTEQGEVQGEQ